MELSSSEVTNFHLFSRISGKGQVELTGALKVSGIFCCFSAVEGVDRQRDSMDKVLYKSPYILLFVQSCITRCGTSVHISSPCGSCAEPGHEPIWGAVLQWRHGHYHSVLEHTQVRHRPL